MGKTKKEMKIQTQNFLFITFLLLLSYSIQKKMYKDLNEEISEIERDNENQEDVEYLPKIKRAFDMSFLKRYLHQIISNTGRPEKKKRLRSMGRYNRRSIKTF